MSSEPRLNPEDGRALSERLKSLTPAQRALLERRLIERGADTARERAIPRRERTSPVPLSYSQELLWLLDQMAPGGSAYNSPSAFRLQGPLDEDVLAAALEELVSRHEILRTTYALIDGRPMQVVSDRSNARVQLVDLGDLPAESREAELQRLCGDEGDCPFDLQTGPLMRPTLFRLGPEENVLLLAFHHIAVDGWSKGILFGELTRIYDHLVEGRAQALPEVEIQYADYAVWHRRWLEEGVLERQLDYWKERLAGAPAALELPTDHARPPVQSYRGNRTSRLLERRLLDGLLALSRAEEATLFMTMLAALTAVLSRYSGQDDIVIGTPTLSRNRAELERVVGYFTNTVALRVDLSGEPSFRELVRRTRETTLGAFAHGDVPYELIVRDVNPHRDPSRSPVFQVMMGLHNEHNPLLGEDGRPRFAPAGIRSTRVGFERTWAKFDLLLGMGEGPQGLGTGFEYSTDLFDAGTIERLGSHLERFVAGAIEDPDRLISRLPLLAPDERSQILVDWNATECDTAQGCLHELVEAQATRTPEAVAVECEGRTLTYAELDARANQLANRLRSLGVRENAHVAIAIDRSLELVVGLLGTLKAGGACVPVDVDYPTERIATMLEDAGAGVVLTREAFAERLPHHSAQVLRLDADWHVVEGESDVPPDTVVGPDDVAYVVYTSGSTGRPRGVLLPHRGLVNHAGAAVDLYRLASADRVLQFASISFDISIEEIFPTLASGGTVVFRSDDTPLAGTPFVEWIAQRGITVLDLPTAFWHAWVNDLSDLGLRVPECVRLLIVGGEKASAEAFRTWRAAGGERVTFVNTYGPTEASVIATAFEVAPDDTSEAPDDLPIGSPIANVTVYILDRNLEPVPVGVPGELYIGGHGVAAGYHRLPDLTAERFVPDPFAGGPSGRLYRTGDVVRWLPDGNIAFVGRVDDQVKIRGFRVEPGEVEAALETHPTVGTAVVVVHEPRPDDRVLAAYVEGTRTDLVPDPSELRDYLAERLPAYMVPSSLTVLDRLPLTPNGKVDRAALPAPAHRDLQAAEIVEPRDDLEAALEAIWCRVLGLRGPLSIHDDFFALGGHSLLAVRLVSEVERALGVRVPLNSLFHGATIEQLAAAVRVEQSSDAEWSPLVSLRADGTKSPLFLLHGMQGELLYYRGLVRHLGEDQPVYGLQPLGLDGRRNPHSSMQEMAGEYVRTLRGVQPNGPYLLAGYCFSGVIAYEVARQLEQEGEPVALLAVIDASPIGLERPTRLELERAKMAEFMRLGGRGKAAWVARRSRGLWQKLRTRAWWALYDVFDLLGRPVPRRLQKISVANARARQTYVTQVSSCRLTLFRAKTGEADDTFSSAWARLATGGVDVRPIATPGIRHDNIMTEPYVQALASDLTDCIERALAGKGEEAGAVHAAEAAAL